MFKFRLSTSFVFEQLVRIVVLFSLVFGLLAGAPGVLTGAAFPYSSLSEIYASDPASGDGFGFSVAAGKDGAGIDTLVVGAPNSNGEAGAVYIFRRGSLITDRWEQVQKLTVAVPANDNSHFGTSVAIAGDILVVGARDYDLSKTLRNAGAAFVYQRSAEGVWTPLGGQLTAEISGTVVPRKNDRLGSAVAASSKVISSGGADVTSYTVLIGAPYEEEVGDPVNSGSVFVFNFVSGSEPGQAVARLNAGPYTQNGDRFGQAVAVDGDTILVGAPRADVGPNDRGRVYQFTSGNWDPSSVVAIDPAGAGQSDLFGSALSVQGNWLVVGAPFDEKVNPQKAGSAYLFYRSSPSAQFMQTHHLVSPQPAAGTLNNQFGSSVAIDGDLLAVGAMDEDIAGMDRGAVYVYERNEGGNNNWGLSAGGVVTNPAGTTNDEFGNAVTLNAGALIIGNSARSRTVNAQGLVYSTLFTPVIDLNGPAEGINFSASYAEGDPAVLIADPALTILDADSARLDYLTVRITNVQDSGAELLAADASGEISYSEITWDAASGTLRIDPTGASDADNTAPLADFEAVLRNLVYLNTAVAPSTVAPRLIEFVANDGSNNSAAAAATVRVVSLPAETITHLQVDGPYKVNAPLTVHVWVTSDLGIPAGSVALTVEPGEHACTIDLDANGEGSCVMSFSSEGSVTWTAEYSPALPSRYQPSSSSLALLVEKYRLYLPITSRK